MKRIYLKAEVRKRQILDTAISLAILRGYKHITRQEIVDEAKIANGLVNAYFGTMAELKREVLLAAIVRKILPIIAQGIVANDPLAICITDELKREALTCAGQYITIAMALADVFEKL